MDEVSSHVRLDLPFRLTARPLQRLLHLILESHNGRALAPIPEEKREPVSDIDTAAADSLKVLDPGRPIREADVPRSSKFWSFSVAANVAIGGPPLPFETLVLRLTTNRVRGGILFRASATQTELSLEDRGAHLHPTAATELIKP